MDRFVQYVLPYLPGCPKQLIEAHVLLAANELCRKSLVWQEEVTETIAAATSEVYLIPYSGGADVVSVKILVNDRPVENYRYAAQAATFESDLAAGDEVEATLYLAPERDATSLPDILYNDWLEGIAAGARASIMRMPGKDWSNPQYAMMEQQAFAHHIGQATLRGREKNIQATNTVRMRSWV